jgi:hypothetical protein
MKKFEVWAHIQQQQMKFYYSLTAISFTILGLSIQFSPKYGNTWPYLLVTSWLILLASSIAGGWRLLIIPNIHRLDFERQNMKKFLKDVEKAENYPGKVIGIPSEEDKQVAKNNISKVESYKNKQNKKIEYTYYIQVYGFLLGIVLNLIFVSINYLN